ncbi:trans-aconitate 2-methyltransferase [Roseovarius pacificus]|uniref:Trans-aconitate 2-methyltransferase n=1 Tax=Roseovarius pacificus TaxID=337701 RepID=A0A1M7F3U0_9RHOB|nr:trans-aconitate 2-methyltransferase [Roseovarius pacificus]SHL98665.1 trans-aconitate 2-methyltransferase [Roseovarius pacificus]
MSGQAAKADWNPGAYARYRDLRLRPGLDLLNAVGQMGVGDVIDLGCGNGALGEALRARAGGRPLVGVDASPAMLEKARQAHGYDNLQQADIREWHPRRAPGLIFSNAALHWVGNHEQLMPRLAGMLGKGGTLAVQMPHQNKAPSHRVWLSLVEELFPGRIEKMGTPGVMAPVKYEELLAPLGQLRLWETEYYQRLVAETGSHPVRRFTESTYARPVLEALEPDEKSELVRRYEDVMKAAYPVRADGSVLFPFRRLFFTLTV